MRMMARVSLMVCLALACGGAVGLTDHVDVADPANVAAHHFASGGDVETAIAGDMVGGHDTRRLAHVVAEGASVSYQIKVVPQSLITIEIEELDGRERDVRGYAVWIDDVRVALRTFQACGAGPVHYFVSFPPRETDHITLKFASAGTSPFRISQIWAFADFATWFDQSGMNVPFRIAPALHLTGEFDADLAHLQQIKQSLGDQPNVLPAWTTWVAYAKWAPAKVSERINHILNLAEASKMPVQICFDSWWANTPSGPDGTGGHWTDDAYQQWVWNDTQKKMQRSIPNQWFNCPWLTMNDPDLNAFKIKRLKEAVTELRLRLRESSASNPRDAILAVNLDNEPVYWASGNAGLGPDLLQADFNPRTIAAAKKDGVALDPTDGLDFNERHWLWKNLLAYNEMISGAAREAIGRDACVVSAAGAKPSDDLLANNIYTQAMVANPLLQYPMLDLAYPLWESAAPAGARVGGEWNRDSLAEQQSVLHQLPLGRNAAVNAECENDAANNAGVRVAYALGQRYFAPYNYPLDKMDLATAALRDLAAPFPSYTYEPALLEHDFHDDSWRKLVASQSDIEVSLIGNMPARAAHPAKSMGVAFLQYHLRAPGDRFNSLEVELFGRCFDFKKANDKIGLRVLVDGVEAGGVTSDRDLNAANRIDLSKLAQGKSAVDVRIELDPAGAQTPEWCCLWRVRFCTGWPAEVASNLLHQDVSLATVRKQNLLVSWRRDAELAIAQMPFAESRAAYSRGDYAEAYHLANRAACTALPATFCVKETGPLTPYPLDVETSHSVTIELRECSSDIIRLTASGAARIHGTKLAPGRRYALSAKGDEWIVAPAESGPLRAGDKGELDFDVDLLPR